VYISDLDLANEWVQIANSGTSPVTMTGWKITDNSTKYKYYFSEFTLSQGATVTLYTCNGGDTGTELYWGYKISVWNNDGDTAWLYDADGSLVDRMDK